MSYTDNLGELMEKAVKLAADYYELTGKPLGITGEVGEFLVAEKLDLELMPPRTEGYDAVSREGLRIEIKARSLDMTRPLSGQRLSRINLAYDWDKLAMLIMDHQFAPQRIYEADRADIEAALTKPGSKARNERGQLGVTKVISIGNLIWENSN